MGTPRKPWSVRRLRHDPAFRRSVILLASASLLLLLAVGNLIAVAEGPPRVTPLRAPAETWTAGEGANAQSGQGEWSFLVEATGRRVVELDLSVPYHIQITHHAGESRLFSNVRVWVDGVQASSTTRHLTMIADEPFARTERGDIGPQLGRIVVERARDAPPFSVQVTWDWIYDGAADATRYAVRVGPVEVQPIALAGVPGCTDTTCARIVLLGALVAQGVSVAWFLRVRDAPRDAVPATRARTDKEK